MSSREIKHCQKEFAVIYDILDNLVSSQKLDNMIDTLIAVL